MLTVNIFHAKTTLSKLIERIERGEEEYVVIARNGCPVARLTRLEPRSVGRRIGIAKGRLKVPDSIDEGNEKVLKMFAQRGR